VNHVMNENIENAYWGFVSKERNIGYKCEPQFSQCYMQHGSGQANGNFVR
jgi:hypothetical protein